MTRPHPVIDIAAIFADRIGRRVNQPYVLHLEPLDQRVFLAAIETGDQATISSVLFAFRGDILHPLIDGIVTLIWRKGVDAFADARRHIADLGGDIHARSGCGGQFFALRLGEEAVFEIVVFSRGIVLHRSTGAVVIGNHQPFVRNEAGRTTLQLDNGAHRKARQVRQGFGRYFQAGFAQIVCDLGQLSGREHPFLGSERRCQRQSGCGRAGEQRRSKNRF